MKSKTIIKWSANEKAELVDYAIKFSVNNRVDWVKVAEHFPGRTSLQCKSYYN